MASAFEPILRSDEGLTGYIHILLSLYFPPEDEARNVPTDGGFQANFLRWMSDDFICGTSFPSFAVELVSTLQMTSDCGSTGDWKSYPPAILWNAPSASIIEEDWYATWNVTYPVYDWGDGNDLQKGLQEAFDSKIANGEFEMPWEEASLSVIGFERNTFDLPAPSIVANTTSNNSTTNSADTLRGGILALDPVTATAVQYIGAILLVVHTILLIAVHLFGNSYAEKQNKAEQALLLDAEGLDDMLLLTKDHKMPESPSPHLILPTSYTTNANNVRLLSPTRSLVSNASKVSSTNYAGDSLLPPMVDDDEVSEAGTEVVVQSIGSGSNHSISSAILDDAGSVRSSNAKQQSGNGSVGADDRSISKGSVGSGGSRRSLGVPSNIGTILGNVDDDEDNVSDIMIF
ncbi:unnamed protein product [Cylindrotheca closterium]|uniref:Uncharacterized protein n=1 Tax=Cylindrotheca closterium TaxID=2856 RepID=A0AAD2CJB8_9STRA|nr:unnamed protein product [Cylindrotheca closterium]